MPSSKPTKTARGVASEPKSPPQGKVYRSVAEIRRSFYPKAGHERSREMRVANHTDRPTKPGGALSA
jgi:hypothetical protein